MKLHPVSFADVPGWVDDDHAAAEPAYLQSIDILRERYLDLPQPGGVPAQAYFEANFQPHRIEHADGGFFTGYYEPELLGSRNRSERFQIPLLRRPRDLVTVIDDSLRASADGALTHARQTPTGLQPYPDRQAIEQGCLDDQGLELCYVSDHIEAYFLHIQGSGVVQLDTGERIRVTYAAKNGHPYTSIGQVLIKQGEFTPAQMSLQALKTWLQRQPDGGRSVLWHNKSYIFFEELARDAASAKGARGINLTAGRSLAVDASYHPLGLPIFIDVPDLQTQTAPAHRRLMIAQDVGSGIRGPERGDIYFGTGDVAGARAGTTKHAGTMYVLIPRCRD